MRISDWSSDVCSSDLNALRKVVAEGAGPRAFEKIFEDDALYANGDKGAASLPIFSGNHDMGRIGHFLLQAVRGKISDDELLRRATLANALLLRSEEHTSELQSLMRISYAVFCLKKKTKQAHSTNKK